MALIGFKATKVKQQRGIEWWQLQRQCWDSVLRLHVSYIIVSTSGIKYLPEMWQWNAMDLHLSWRIILRSIFVDSPGVYQFRCWVADRLLAAEGTKRSKSWYVVHHFVSGRASRARHTCIPFAHMDVFVFSWRHRCVCIYIYVYVNIYYVYTCIHICYIIYINIVCLFVCLFIY